MAESGAEMAWDDVGPSFSCEDKSILFVFGAARSGTTILNNLLHRNFGYGMGPEGTFVAEWARRVPRYGELAQQDNVRRLVADLSKCRMLHIVRHKYRRNPFDVTPELILGKLREKSYAGIVYAIFECMAELQGCPRVGNKNPGYGRQFPLLHRLFPTQAKYLCIVRDGRDVALSILRVRWGPSSSYVAAKVWSESLMALAVMQQQLGPDRVHVLRYEDLLRSPHIVLEDVRKFLSIPAAEARIDAAAAEILKGQRATNFDKWKREMSPRDLSLFEGLAGHWLEKYGYELSGQPTRITWADRLYYEAKEVTRLIAINLKHRLGTGPG
jgi:hypothetical protein